MPQLIPINPIGAAGRQIVETAVNPLTVYADARAKAEEVAQTRQLGAQRLEAGRNALAEYQREQRVRSLSQRAMSGDAEARQALMAEAPEVLEANIKRVQGALKDSAPTLLPVVGRAVQMAQDGATPEQIYQYMRQQDTGALDLIFGPAGGFGVEDATPEALMQFGEQLAAYQPQLEAGSDVGKLLADADRFEAAGNTAAAQTLRAAAAAKGRPAGKGRPINVGGQWRVFDPETNSLGPALGPAGSPRSDRQFNRRISVDENGRAVIEEGYGALPTARNSALDTQAMSLAEGVSALDNFIARLDTAPTGATGIVGKAVTTGAAGLEMLGMSPEEHMRAAANALGSQTLADAAGSIGAIRDIRAEASTLMTILLPFQDPSGRYSDKDAERAAAYLNDFTTANIGSVTAAKAKLKAVRDLMERMRQRRVEALRSGQLGGGARVNAPPAGDFDLGGGDLPDPNDLLDEYEAQLEEPQ